MATDQERQWSNDPENWKWGIFYFNKQDKRIFPPKRIPGMGWTINFASPASVLAFIALIVSILLITIYISEYVTKS